VAIGNLAGFLLQRERREPLAWQVVRVETGHAHHFRLVVRHRERALDLGIGRDLSRILDSLSDETLDELRTRFETAQREGLTPVALRHLHEEVDYWRDDFWNWLG